MIFSIQNVLQNHRNMSFRLAKRLMNTDQRFLCFSDTRHVYLIDCMWETAFWSIYYFCFFLNLSFFSGSTQHWYIILSYTFPKSNERYLYDKPRQFPCKQRVTSWLKISRTGNANLLSSQIFHAHFTKVKLLWIIIYQSLQINAASTIHFWSSQNKHGSCFPKEPTWYEGDRNDRHCPQQPQGETDVLSELHGYGKIRSWKSDA